MATPTADKLRIFFPSKYLLADDDPLTQYTADAGGGETTIVDAALIEAAGYWDGAIGWFDGNTPTPELQGAFFHVKSFVTGTLTLSRDLPGVPQAGDTYRLVLGGNYRSSQETFGMLMGGVLPELNPAAGLNITGLTIKKASAKLGAGTLTVQYNQTLEEIYIKMDAQNFGVGLDVSADLTDAVIFAEDGQGWILVDVVAISLPPGDATDTWTLSHPQQTLTPDYEGYETKNALGGKTRYRLEAAMNTDPLDSMVGLSVYTGRPYAPPSVISVGGSLGTGQGSFDVDDASAWPTKGFWIKNTTANAGAGDCRYVNYRSGNTLYCFAVEWATLGFDAGITQINPGDQITDAVTGATAIVDQVEVTSGDWVTNDAVGTLLLKQVVGSFGDNNALQVSAATVATADGNSVLGLRGYTAVNWNAGDAIDLMADVDIGFDKPGALQYENPAAETIAPPNVVFKDAAVQNEAVDLGNLGASKLHGVWRREWIIDEHQARAGINADTHYSWS